MSRNTDKDPHRYDDMLDLPHHQSSTKPRMSVSNRAAQFSPFAALTGYDAEIRETARLTDEKIELADNEKDRLDEKLRIIAEHLDQHPLFPLPTLYQTQEKMAEAIRLTQELSRE